MNTNRLAQHYGNLDGPQRYGLMVSAQARGDDPEYARLVREARTEFWRLPDYYAAAEAWLVVALLHYIEVADLMGLSLRLWAQADSEFFDEETRKQAVEVASMLEYRVLEEVRAWVKLGKEHGVDALHLWAGLTPWDRLRGEIARAKRSAMTRAAFEGFWRRSAPDLPARLPRYAAVALRRLRANLMMFLNSWKSAPAVGG
jgi:hypothetical protein